ncbi:conjugal transfer protein TraD [Lysobacter sp. Root690]|uniref:conjugal transfer protein TraD n=1 Tax=Lysobacter sp. Root690 TaxID=1736588 RepID=UPI000B20D828|nr:conjugal transfer protein TraD [Lysobacter sp. Root690]
MGMKDRLHEQISNATSRLAKLQARQLLASQRQAEKDRAARRRQDRLRRERLAELVIAAGCDHLADTEIVGVLVHYRQEATESQRTEVEALGNAALGEEAISDT